MPLLRTIRKQQEASGITGQHRTAGGRLRYEILLLAIVSTAAITWQIALVSVSPRCDTTHKSKSTAATKQTKGTKHWILDEQYSFESIPSRTWKIHEHPFPCYPRGNTKNQQWLQSTEPCREGILFQRPTKVGSTTMTNIVMRLAFNRGEQAVQKELDNLQANSGTNQTSRQSDYLEQQTQQILRKWKSTAVCEYRSNHGTSIEYEYSQRNKEKSFLFSLVRDPTQRAISAYFHFVVSYYQETPTDENFQRYLNSITAKHNLIRELTLDPKLDDKMKEEFRRYQKQWTQKLHPQPPSLNYTKIVDDILQNYDFIAVMERMDESLVALKLLLGLSTEEILYAKISRSAGSFDHGPPERPCIYLVPSFLSDGMQNYFYHHNDRWIAYTQGDALLHRAAMKSLDRTIDEVFGRTYFEKELEEFRNALRYAQELCSSEPDLVLSMCDATGIPVDQATNNRSTTCYIWNDGCDHRCLNEIVPNPMPRAILEGIQTFEE